MNTHLANISSLPVFGATDNQAAGKPGFLARAVHWLADTARQRREQSELTQFSDRELADIGLTRSDLDRIQSKSDRSHVVL